MSVFRRSVRDKLATTDRRKLSIPELAFGEQRAAVECNAPAVLLSCSGRSGKSRGFCLKWLQVAERKPGQISVYVALTRGSAKRVAWAQLKQLNRELGLGLTFLSAELTVLHPNGSQLIMLGANRDDLIDVLRGFPIALIGFDEAAFFRNDLLRRAIDDAVLIRLMDLEGELWVMSTPGYVCAGYHYDALTGAIGGFKTFSWSFFDNPHLPLEHQDKSLEWRANWRREYARKEMARKGWNEETPSYIRDFRGLYSQDLEALVYRFNREIHTVEAMPKSWTLTRERWTTVLGIDFGSTNATSWVLLAFEQHSPIVYVVKVRKSYGMAPSATADVTKQWIEDWKPYAVVGDSAAKGYIDEHAVRHQIAIEGADKLHKRSHQILVNDALCASPEPRLRLVAGACEDLASEMERLGKDPRYDKHDPKYGEEDPRGEKDACDGMLYGFVKCYAWLEEIERLQEQERLARLRRGGDPDPEDTGVANGPRDELRYLM